MTSWQSMGPVHTGLQAQVGQRAPVPVQSSLHGPGGGPGPLSCTFLQHHTHPGTSLCPFSYLDSPPSCRQVPLRVRERQLLPYLHQGLQGGQTSSAAFPSLTSCDGHSLRKGTEGETLRKGHLGRTQSERVKAGEPCGDKLLVNLGSIFRNDYSP